MIRILGCFWLPLLVGLAGCADPEQAAEGPAALEIAVVPKGTTHEFWKAVHAGAVKAERELGAEGADVSVIWQGPFREDDRDTQIQVVENFTARNVSALVLAPLDSRALVRPVAAAVAAGIPVVVIDSDLQGEHHASFVATDNYAGGVMAARHLSARLNGRGRVILFRYAVGSASTEAREQGFLDSLAREHPGLEVLSSTEYAGPTRETAYRTGQALLNRLGGQVDGIFAVNENSTIGMTMALKEIGRGAGDVVMIGFDAGTQSIADLAAGDVQALVVQDPLTMGYAGVMTAVTVLRGEPVEARVDTGVVLVTRENMNDAAVEPLLNPPLDEYLD
jgi:ribose transport system substrate-binding protein